MRVRTKLLIIGLLLSLVPIGIVGFVSIQVGKKAIIRWKPEQPGDVRTTCADITKARTLLGYRPATSIDAGIDAFVNWHEMREISTKPIFPRLAVAS